MGKEEGTEKEWRTRTVKELAGISGVSVRTLHHYDAIGLLLPSARTEAGYRLYGRAEYLRLQQILFYREMGWLSKRSAKSWTRPISIWSRL